MSVIKQSVSGITDGVQLFGTPEKVGPFKQYQGFAIAVSGENALVFQVGKIYRVRTIRTNGFARLTTVFQNEKTSKCFSKFTLHYFPEDTKNGRINFKHGEDELLTFAHGITIRCCNVLAWTIPAPDKFSSGTTTFTNDEMEVHQSGENSLIRLKKQSILAELGKHSTFAGNATLGKKLAIDVTAVQYLPHVTRDVPSSSQVQGAPSRTWQANDHDRKVADGFHHSCSKAGSSKLPFDTAVPRNETQSSRKLAGGKLPPGHQVGSMRTSTCRPGKNLAKAATTTAPTVTLTTSTARPARSCRSIYGSNRKRALEEESQETSTEEVAASKKSKIEDPCVHNVSHVAPMATTSVPRNIREKELLRQREAAENGSSTTTTTKTTKETPASRKRRREPENTVGESQYVEGERECKVKIMSYHDYVAFRKCKKGLMAGLVIKKEEGLEKGVLTMGSDKHHVFFTRSLFSEKDIERSLLFEKLPERKCEFGKKRKTQVHHDSLMKSISKTKGGDDFKEESWKEESDDVYFEKVGNENARESKQGKYLKVPRVKRTNVPINDRPAYDFENDTKNDEAEKMLSAFVKDY
eukprot:Seg508.16 transcript_id=Seg508.16/GoldUCD/mRNA.D3Y31 product="AT-rich interactive domain-containing protein 5B" protein_id=Seg508.16/GoldUCD/D3Y31